MILVTRAGGGRSLAAGVRERVETAVPQVAVARIKHSMSRSRLA